MSGVGHQRAWSLLPAFVLDAVDSIERDFLNEHIASCELCTAETNTLRAAAADLDHAQERPPQRVWDAIASRVARPAPAPLPPPTVAGPGRIVTAARVAHEVTVQAEAEVTLLVAEATHKLLWIDEEIEAVRIVRGVVEALGGSVVPGDLVLESMPDVIPVDISFGTCESLLPVAPPMSIARLHMEEVLPGLLEDARRAVGIVRNRRRPR